MEILTMHFTLGDIVELLGLFIVGLSAYVSIRKSIVKLEVNNQNMKEELISVKGKIDKVQDDDKLDKNEIWKKLASIETTQTETNIFLKENLKHLTFIIESHDNRLDNIKERLEYYDNNIMEFYKNYELKLKKSE